MNRQSENYIHSIKVTVHARNRWEQRGFRGQSGLFYELGKAQELNDINASCEEDLRHFLRIESMFNHNREGRRYYYTSYFVFIIENQTLITCLARATLLSNKHVVASRGKRRKHR